MAVEISFDNFITSTLALVNKTIEGHVTHIYSSVYQHYIAGFITLLATVYVMWFGYQVLYQKVKLDVMTIASHLTLLVIVVALVSTWGQFDRFFYRIFTEEPALIAKAMTGEDSGQALNNIWKSGSAMGSQLIARSGIGSLGLLFSGIAIYVATFLNCIFALCLMVYAKIALAAILAVGQIFVLMTLWKSTREFFGSWLRALFNFAFIPIITVSILLITLSAAQNTIKPLEVLKDITSVKPSMVLPFLGISLVNFFLLKQVLNIASMLSSSLSLESVGGAFSMTKNALRGAGSPIRQAQNIRQRLKTRKEQRRLKGA